MAHCGVRHLPGPRAHVACELRPATVGSRRTTEADLDCSLDVLDIDRCELVVIVRARFALRVHHDTHLVFQFFDSGHEVALSAHTGPAQIPPR